MLEFTLLDDGTMDTVVQCDCTKCGKSWMERFIDTADYRELDTGMLTVESLQSMMVEADIYCDCEE